MQPCASHGQRFQLLPGDDAVELGKYLHVWENRPHAPGERMPNPALILGRTSGAVLESNQLMETLDEDTVSALRWQVEMWNEVGTVQNQVKLDAMEYGILRGVVLPRRTAPAVPVPSSRWRS